MESLDNTMDVDTKVDGDDDNSNDIYLLEQTQKLIYAEKRLTKLLRQSEPWLPNAVPHPHRQRVRPIPSTMDQVESILALARKYAAQTSAPAGWNPQAPVVGFCTPSPLPNQLRAGNLAALQLERAQAERKRQREQATQQKLAAAAAKEEAEAAAAAAKSTVSEGTSTDEPDSKRREVKFQDKHVERVPTAASQRPGATAVAAATTAPQKPVVDSMNLSDSSDDDDSDDD